MKVFCLLFIVFSASISLSAQSLFPPQPIITELEIYDVQTVVKLVVVCISSGCGVSCNYPQIKYDFVSSNGRIKATLRQQLLQPIHNNNRNRAYITGDIIRIRGGAWLPSAAISEIQVILGGVPAEFESASKIRYIIY